MHGYRGYRGWSFTRHFPTTWLIRFFTGGKRAQITAGAAPAHQVSQEGFATAPEEGRGATSTGARSSFQRASGGERGEARPGTITRDTCGRSRRALQCARTGGGSRGRGAGVQHMLHRELFEQGSEEDAVLLHVHAHGVSWHVDVDMQQDLFRVPVPAVQEGSRQGVFERQIMTGMMSCQAWLAWLCLRAVMMRARGIFYRTRRIPVCKAPAAQ